MVVAFLPWRVKRAALRPQDSRVFSGTSFAILFCSLLLRLPDGGPTYLKLIGVFQLASVLFEMGSSSHLISPF